MTKPIQRHINCDAMRTLRRLVADALRVASPTVEQLAERLGCSTSALRRWRLGNRQVSPEVATRLAGQLRRQARELERVAGELDQHTKARGGKDD